MDKAQENDITSPKEADLRPTVTIESLNLQEHIDADTVELETLVTRQTLYEDSTQNSSDVRNTTNSNANTVIGIQEALVVITELGVVNIHENSKGCDSTNSVNYARNDAEKRTIFNLYTRLMEIKDDIRLRIQLFLEKHIGYKYFAASLGIHVLFGIFIFAYEFDSKYNYCNDICLEHMYIFGTILFFAVESLAKLFDMTKLWYISSSIELNLFFIVLCYLTVKAMIVGLIPKNMHVDPNNYYCRGFLIGYGAVENTQ